MSSRDEDKQNNLSGNNISDFLFNSLNDSNLTILYITFGIVLILIIIWIIIIFVTKENPVEILNEMNNTNNHKLSSLDNIDDEININNDVPDQQLEIDNYPDEYPDTDSSV